MQRNPFIAASLSLGLAFASVNSLGKEIDLPADVSALRPSDLPGYQLARQKCGICHSADYISHQAPGLDQAQWTAEMRKMQHSYGAPIDEQEIESIGAYLAVAYGTAKATDASVIAASAAPEAAARAAATGATIEVQALLVSNACLGCHAVDHKIVGPAFHDVAARYAAEPDARTMLAVSIRNGGVGKWGDVGMPPMATLDEAQAKALAAYVLEQ